LNITPFLDETRLHHPIFGIFKDREGYNPTIKTRAVRVQEKVGASVDTGIMCYGLSKKY
jgi:hypothetical protein